MPTWAIVLIIIAGILLAVVLAAALYFICSPMPVVRLLRRGLGEDLEYPEGCEERTGRITVKKDISYPSEFGKNTFDLYLPEQAQCAPVIIWVHGGAFVAGDKCGVENWGRMLAGDGYAVAAMNYEWAPEAAYPAQVAQVAACIKQLAVMRDEGAPLDMSRVALAGDSAGAHIAAQFALVHAEPAFARRLGVASPLEQAALRCLLLYCGPYDVEKMMSVGHKLLRLFISRIGWSYLGQKNWKKSRWLETVSVARHVTSRFPPAYITDGNAFSFEPQGRALAQRLRELGVLVQERFFPAEAGEVPHEYQMKLSQPNAALCYTDTIRFLQETAAGNPREGR